MSEGGVGNIRVWLVSAVPVRASDVPMVVWAGNSELVCIAVPSLCSLVTVAAASMVALATWADIFASSSPTVSALAVVDVAAGWGSPLTMRVDILNGDCNK